MAYERHWEEAPERPISSDGGADGSVTLSDLSGFYVKQQVTLKSNAVTSRVYQVKKIDIYNSKIFLGDVGKPIGQLSDLSDFTLADSATIKAEKQPKNTVPKDDQTQGTYETEPIVARRVILVDNQGNKISSENPLPVDASVSVVVPPVTVDLDALTPPTQANPDNVLIVGSEDGTKTGTKYGWVNNIKQQILSSHDRKRDAFYLDVNNRRNRRLDKFEYTSPTFPGVTLVRQFSWKLVGNEYVYEADEWLVV